MSGFDKAAFDKMLEDNFGAPNEYRRCWTNIPRCEKCTDLINGAIRVGTELGFPDPKGVRAYLYAVTIGCHQTDSLLFPRPNPVWVDLVTAVFAWRRNLERRSQAASP